MKIIAIKAFRKDLTLTPGGFTFEEGMSYRADGRNGLPTLDEGFLAWPPGTDILTIFEDFPPASSRYFEVGLSGYVSTEGGLYRGTRMTILKELTVEDLYGRAASREDGPDYESGVRSLLLSRTAKGAILNTGEKSVSGSTLDTGRAVTAREYSAASVTGKASFALCNGSHSVAGGSGESSSSLAGGLESIAANSGRYGFSQSTGNDGVAVTSGPYGRSLTSGDGAVALSTDTKGRAVCRGKRSISLVTGHFADAVAERAGSIAIAAGPQSTACGVLGCLLVWVDRDDDGQPSMVSAMVDGEHIMPGVPYKLVDGVIREEGYKKEEEYDDDTY